MIYELRFSIAASALALRRLLNRESYIENRKLSIYRPGQDLQ